jgi:hypothetical protein
MMSVRINRKLYPQFILITTVEIRESKRHNDEKSNNHFGKNPYF